MQVWGGAMTGRVDLSMLPADLAAFYAGACDPEQLALPVEPAETEFKRWLESQPQPDWMDAA
jgi:hypothetical protein